MKEELFPASGPNAARREEYGAALEVLGAAIQDGRCVGVLDGIAEADYNDPSHALIHRAIRLYAERHRDLVLPRQRVDIHRLSQIVDEIGGDRATIAQIQWGLPPSLVNAEHYAAIVRRGGALRRGQELAQKFTQAYREGLSDLSEIEALATALAGESGGAQSGSDWTTGLELAQLVVRESDAARERGSAISGIETGFSTIDSTTDGYQGGQFWILAGRPSTGKSVWALNSAIHVARSAKKPVCFVSLEMTARELGERAIANLARLNSYTIRRGSFRAEDYPRFARGCGILGELNLNVVEGASLSVDDIRARVRRMHWQQPLGLVVVDYLQLVRPRAGGGNRSRENEVSEISRGLKSLALDLKVPVLALSQFNRAADTRKPRLSDLRESGALEQDADVAILLHREKDEDTTITAIVAKNRNGARGVEVELDFDGPTTTFEEVRK